MTRIKIFDKFIEFLVSIRNYFRKKSPIINLSISPTSSAK